MIARFFIDRPIFATVLSVVIALIGFIALLGLPVAQYPRITPPGVAVSISYPGADARTVRDSVAAPIEQQVTGVDGMLYMSSQCGNDGTYSLTVTFDLGVDLKTALVKVQNRVALAMPQLPTQVQNQGITIRKKTPDILLIVNLISPEKRYDDLYLSNFATIYIKDELLRVPGVSDITIQGQRDYSIRAWLDPQKLAALSMTPIDVANAIREQNLDAPAGILGQPPSQPGQLFALPIDTLGRFATPEEFGNIIVKVGQRRAATAPIAAPTPTSSGSGTSTSGGGSMTGGPNGSGMTSPSTTNPSGMTSGSTPATTTPSTISSGTPTTTIASGTTGAPSSSSITNTYTWSGPSITGGLPTALTPAALSGANLARGPGRASAGIVRLRDVARMELGAQNYNQSCTFDGQPSVGLGVYQLPTTNALDVADAVRAKMEELKARFPAGIDYRIAYDITPYIRESVADVVVTLLEAVALVGLVVLVFLQDWRAMILPMIDVPVSIIGTFAVMAALGFSLNNISLFGLVLAIGIVVDDAIVVLENIERLMATGLDARTATIKAMDEVTGPIIAVALVLSAVFVPCALIGGITGQFFRQFAVTISVSTVISAINAITMTPSRAVMLFRKDEGGRMKDESKETSGPVHPSSFIPHPSREALPWWIFSAAGGLLTVWFLPGLLAGHFGLPSKPAEVDPAIVVPTLSGWRWWAVQAAWFAPGALAGGLFGWFFIGPINAGLGWLFRRFNHYFDRMALGYGWTVGKGLRGSALVLLVYFGLLGLTWWVFQRAPTGFIPQQDQGRLIVNIQLPDSASLQRTEEAVARVVKIALKTEGVAHVVATAGMSFLLQANSSNFASMFIVLDPFSKRSGKPELRDTAIMETLKKRWAAGVQEASVTVFPSAPIPGLGTAGGFKFMVEDRGGQGLTQLQKRTESLIADLKTIPGLKDVVTQFRSSTPQYFADIDWTKAAALGVSIDDLNQTLDMYLGSLYVNSFSAFGRHWQVTVQADGKFRAQASGINLFQVRNSKGQMVPLGTLVTMREVTGPLSVTRYNLYTAAAVNGNVLPGYSTGDVIAAIDKMAAEKLPLSMTADWTELMFMQKRAGNTSFYIFLLSVLCVFLALASLYESWSLPLAVILVVPLCLLCSVAGVRFTDRDVNIFVQIGLVVLVGLACKNAILVVEYARQLHQEGRSVFDATVEASRLRLRPILMTSFAFILGVVPLVIAAGAGAEMRRSLGIAVFSGMLGVTLFGIFLTPVFFFVIQGVGESKLFASERMRQTGDIMRFVLGILTLGLLYVLPVLLRRSVEHPPSEDASDQPPAELNRSEGPP
jgi:multidrug efflux pump